VGTPKPAGMAQTVQLGLRDLQTHYSHLVFATGCTLPALHNALADSPWCMPALGFVHWYTQHPSAPPPPALDMLTHVALIGNGNVALDIARILLTPPSVLER
jgi:adrenodoxin-NADP+ reductase